MQRRSNHGRAPGEDERRSGYFLPGVANPTRPPDHNQQVVTKDGWRQRQRQRRQSVQQVLARKLLVRQQPREPDSEDQRDQGSKRGYFETQPEREPVDRHVERFFIVP